MAVTTISPSASPSSSQEIYIFPDTKNVINHLKFTRSVEEIKQIHCQITKNGFFQFPVASSNLISAYSRAATAQSLAYAIKTFDLLNEEHKGALFLRNSLIRGFSSAGYIDEAIELFVQMFDEGLIPDRFTFPPLLAGLTKAFALKEGAWLHGLLLKVGSHGGLQDDIFIQNSLIHFYAEQGELESARKVFDSMRERNVVSWTSLIDGYARGDEPQKAGDLFWDMVEDGRVAPNSVSTACVISACAKLQDLETGERVFAYALDSGVEFSSSLVNTLVDMYMKCGAVEVAERLFHECADRNTVLWNTMLSNYAHRGMAQKAVDLFNDMLISGLKPDRVTIVAVASALAQLGNEEAMTGRRIHGYILRNSLDVSHDVSNSIIDLYMKCQELDSAFQVFNGMKQKTVASWNTVINGCIRNGDWASAWKHFEEMPRRDEVSWNTMIAALVRESWFEDAISFFREMLSSGMRPDTVTMVSIASACGHLCALDLAKWTYAYINRNKIPTDIKLNTALVDMFARCGDTKSSMKIFDKMPNRDVSAWTAAIGAMAVEGNGRKAMELFSEMIKNGLKPDSIVFVQVLTACSHGGMVEEGLHFFHSMTTDFQFAPQVVHYGCLVDLLGRAGRLGEARAVIESMPVEPNDVVWGALLAASCIHHDVEQAEHAAEKVLELAPDRSGIHVLLSNAYASAGRWKDVAGVRLSLKEKGVRKPPGSSLIEIEGMIHEFTSSSVESHHQTELISEMLQEMGHKLSLAGYVPELNEVLLDVDEEEKRFLLSRHSEKMAVAFGLVRSDRGVPIRVVKNLRICSDCHSFMKIVSVIYGREITVRDNNRFHCFERGKCSCRDYW